jgi:ABC-type transporter Mla subunit MlaD|tara:strand:- start:1029 stop:1208 length:180 start_codon:yes stop_codon:yes gene_type:complete
MYITRQELKIEVRDLHGQIREIISDFNGAIRNLREDTEELDARINNLETIITNLKDFGK